MAKRKAKRPWTDEDLAKLSELVVEGYTAPEVAEKLDRSESAIRVQAHVRGLSWKQHGNPILLRALLRIANYEEGDMPCPAAVEMKAIAKRAIAQVRAHE